MSTHIGKIGRLSRDLRQLLGERIEDGVPNKELVVWLNESAEVQQVLALRFEGRAITEQNLSEWKQTGHLTWLRREERRALALSLLEQRDAEALEPEEMAAQQEVSDRLGRELGLEMARLALALVEQDGNTEDRWKRLCAVYREVSRLRRDDAQGDRARMQREKWERERERLDVSRQSWEALTERMAPVRLAVEAMMVDTQAVRRQRAERKAKTCVRKGKANDGAGVRPPRPEGGEEAPSTNIEHSTTNAQHSGEPPMSASVKAMADELEGMENGAKTGEIQPNPSKSNQHTDEETRPD